MKPVTILHVSDLHFGWPADLEQAEVLEEVAGIYRPDAIAISGDLTQRARHGEFQRAHVFVRRMRQTAPTLVIPGNHDVQWWRSPLGLFGFRRRYEKYLHYFGPDLTPTLELPGLVMASALTAHGFSWGSLTLNPNDVSVKGHLPRAETDRVAKIFAAAPPDAAKVLVIHHNVLAGELSRRMGLARWRSAHRRLLATGADVVLCGHDHQEAAGQIEQRLAVSISGTHSSRSRGGRPSAFNLVRIDRDAVWVEHHRWDRERRRFARSDTFAFARGRAEVGVSQTAVEPRP
ncbi:MAG TPA: metallophosphoesterase [Gemmatimonadales bacterium]|nr:metallophosphoesterase [Gemmatimonadales bacterium]